MATPSTDTSEQRFVGWFRPLGCPTWHRFVETGSYDGAFDVLLDSVKESGDTIVLPFGKHPRERTGRPLRVTR